MVNFHDPAVMAQDFFVVVKFWYTVEGLYIWEFFTNLDYEWSVIQGRRPYRWTIWIYSSTRIATLVYVILNIGGFAFTRPYNCQVWIDVELSFAYLALAAASLLIVLRIIAIWNRHKAVTAFVIGAWVISRGFLIQDIVRLRAAWSPAQNTCALLNPGSTRPYLNIIVTFATDVVLLLIMLIGLFQSHCRGGGLLGLGRFLWKQGIIWLVLATTAAVVPTVFICLNLNDPFNIMFQVPSLIIMSIAATRMHRSLVDFGTPNSSQTSGGVGSETKRLSAAPIPLSRMQVAIHTTYERYPTSQTGHQDSSVTVDEHLRDKPGGLGLGDDVEQRGEMIPAP